MPSKVNSSGSVYSTSDWLNNHFSIKSQGRFRYMEGLPIRSGDRILDVGCANGSWSRLMAERVGSAGSVLAVDHDPDLIEQASRSIRDTHLRDRLTFSVMDLPKGLADIDPDYTVVTAFNVVSLLPDATSLLQAIRGMLMPRRGLLVLKDSAISTDFYWPMKNELAHEVRRRLASGGLINGYDPNFALRCRSLLSRCGFSIDDTMLHSYPFMHPFSPEEKRYISGNASMIVEIDSTDRPSSDLEEWALTTVSEDGPFFEDPDAIYTTTEFTYICSIK